MSENKSIIYIENRNIGLFLNEFKNITCRIYPFLLTNNKLSFESSDESVVKIEKQVLNTITIFAQSQGFAVITVKSVEDETIVSSINIKVSASINAPSIHQEVYSGKKVSLTLDDSRKASYKTLVDFAWDAKNEVDLTVAGNLIEFEVPKYDVDYYIKMAYTNGIDKSEWTTKRIRASVKTESEIAEELEEKIQRDNISLSITSGIFGNDNCIYSVFFKGQNVTDIEYILSWESEDKINKITYNKDLLQTTVEVKCPDEFTIYTIQARGLNKEGKSTIWIKEQLNDKMYGSTNPSRTEYNMDYAFMVAFEEDGTETPNLYDSVQGGINRPISFGEVFTTDRLDDDNYIDCPGNSTIYMVADSDPSIGRNHAWGYVYDGYGDKHFVDTGELFTNYYNIKSLCYENCLGNGEGGFILFLDDSSNLATLDKFTVIVRDNFAVAGVTINGVLKPAAGFKLLRDVEIYDVNGSELKTLTKDTWIWLTAEYAKLSTDDSRKVDYNYITGGEARPGNRLQMAIHSYSTEPSVSEIVANWALDEEGNKEGIYYIDNYFNEDISSYCIDTRHLSNRKIIGDGDIVNGYFDFEDYGDSALIWTGSKYAIRNSIDSTNTVPNENIIAYMHQGYVISTSTGEDIYKSLVGDACIWDSFDSSKLYKNLNNFVVGLKDKFTDRHRIEQFFFAKGFFDAEVETEGYFVGDKKIALCTKNCRHSQNEQHISYENSQLDLDTGTQKELVIDKEYNIVIDNSGVDDGKGDIGGVGGGEDGGPTEDVGDENTDEVVDGENNIPTEDVVDENNTKNSKIIDEIVDDYNYKGPNYLSNFQSLIGISNTVLSSFYPYIQYIQKRIRKKCFEKTDLPIDLLEGLYTSYDSNFAIYNDPINGIKINDTISYRPLYGAKVLNDNTLLYVQQSITSKTLILAKNSNYKNIKLSKGDWVWFSEDYPPKIANTNQNCISIVGFSFGTNEFNDPSGQVLIAPCYVDAGLSKVTKDEESWLDKITKLTGINIDKRPENDITHRYSALHYNVATMANANGIEPHLLYESDYYGKIINNTLCYNFSPNVINLKMDDETQDIIKQGRLFTFISEYSVGNIKYSRVYYYSDITKSYKYGAIETPATSLFDYYIMNSCTSTITVDDEEYGFLPLPSVTKIYTKYGEYFATTEVRESAMDGVMFNNKIKYKQKSEKFDIMNLPKYIANKGLGMVDDTVNGLNEVNEPLIEPVIPNWFKIEYYFYLGYQKYEMKQKIDGYVKLDFSIDYRGKFS